MSTPTPTPIHITITGLSVYTTLAQPKAGQHQTMEEVAALAAINKLARDGHQIEFGRHPLHDLARDIIHPEAFGYLANPEIRAAALEALK